MRPSILFLVVASAVALVAEAAPAAAQQRAGVVLRFRGWRAAQARAQVVRALQDRATLIPRDRAEAAARAAGVSLREPSGMAAIATEIGAQFFVAGDVRGRGSRARTVLRIYDASGAELAQRSAPRPVGAARLRRIRQAALAAFDEAEAKMARAEAEQAAARRAELERQRQRLEAQARAEEEEAADDDEPAPTLPRLQALLGLDLRRRQADVSAEVGLGREYEAGFFPELTLELRSYPAASADSLLRGLYAQLDLAFAMGLSTEERDQDGNAVTTDISTSAWRLAAHVGYLYATDDDLLRVGGLLGFGVDKFSIGANMTMPSSTYTYLRLGAVADVRLYQALLRARLDLGFRATFGVGDLVPAFGDDSKQRGFDVGLGLYGQIDLGLTYGLRVGYSRYSVDFSGDPGAVPAAFDAKGMNDANVSLGLQLGYTY